jgi:hypothetical protein
LLWHNYTSNALFDEATIQGWLNFEDGIYEEDWQAQAAVISYLHAG